MSCIDRATLQSPATSLAPRLPLALQKLVLSHFYRAVRKQGGADDRCKLPLLPPLSLVSKQWAAWTRHHYGLYPYLDFRLADQDVRYDRIDNVIERRKGISCWCHDEAVLEIVLDNPEGKSYAARQKGWKKELERVAKQFGTVQQLDLRFADDDSGEYYELAFRFPREVAFFSCVLLLRALIDRT